MKRVLLFAGLLLGLITTASAAELNSQKHNNTILKNKNYRFAQPIIFIEQGVEFLIFPDGSFDFNTNVRYSFYNNRYHKRRRSNVNSVYRGPNNRYNKFNNNRRVIISRDRNGNVRRIGNVFLNYDRFGRIIRAGSVFMNYSRRGRNSSLIQVGNLSVDFNRWGEIVYTRGKVHRFQNDYCNLCGVASCDVTHDFKRGKNHRNDHRDNNDWHQDRNNNIFKDTDDYYFYKRNGKIKKHKRKR